MFSVFLLHSNKKLKRIYGLKEMEVADMKSNLLFDNEIVKYFFLFYFVNQAVRAFMFEQ